MALQSQLFRGDPKLEAAAVSNSAHIVPGAVGEHVAKIQQALMRLDRAAIDSGELAAKSYGQSTANAVLSYKIKRNIINRSYQTKADNIVGIMTMAALDREMQMRIDPIVTIGRLMVAPNPPMANITRSFGPDAAGSFRSGAEASFLRSVVRGNPYVSTGASSADGMPDSLPPTKTYVVQVLVEPPLNGTGQFIELSIVNSSFDNGTARVFPTRITRSTSVTVTGGAQTTPGHAAQLQIQAKLDGVTVKATSAGFSVCAHPLNMEETFFKDLNSSTAVGIIVKVALKSDSGKFEDLDKIEMSEVVEQFRKDEPPFKQGSGFANNSGYGPLIPPPGKALADTHGEPRPDPGPKGISNRIQLHIFRCNRCGAIDKVVPNSGFDIKHEVFQVGKLFKHRATKVGAEIGIQPPGKPVFKSKAGSANNCRSPDHDLP